LEARKHFADLLDAAERGDRVVVERRGVLFEFAVRRRPTSRARRPSLIEVVDPAVARGRWTWRADGDGLAFEPRKRRA
jgi:antitoxin (DNA-binding transcriptional repressor) of toxin-antitoxin stability system